MVIIISIKLQYNSSNGSKTRKIPEHFYGRIVEFNYEDVHGTVHIKKHELPLNATMEDIENYIKDNFDNLNFESSTIRDLKRENEAMQDMLLAILQKGDV